MREMLHDNVNPFLGACFEGPQPCALFQFCPKGSLQVFTIIARRLYALNIATLKMGQAKE